MSAPAEPIGLLAELDLYLDEGADLIARAEFLQAAFERAAAPEGHRLLAAHVLIALDRLQHGMRCRRAALEAAARAAPPGASPIPAQPSKGASPGAPPQVAPLQAAPGPRRGFWQGWFGVQARISGPPRWRRT